MNPLWKYLNLIRKKPVIIPRAISALTRAKLFRQKTLRGAELAVTYRCQARCGKCSTLTLVEPERPEMTVAEIGAIARQIADAGGILIDITGGEPLLRDDIVAIVQAVGRLPVITSMASNGLLLTEALARTLRQAGIAVFQFGLSSPVPEEHDREIGAPGSFTAVFAAVERARRLGIDVLLNTVVTREILHSFRMRQLCDLARLHRCFLSLILPAPVGGWTGKAVALDAQDYVLLRQWLRYPFVTMDTETCYHNGGCPAGTEKIYISAYGDVYPCPFIQQKVGNVLSAGLKPLWQKMATQRYARCVNVAANP